MSIWLSLLLGFVQGATEFLPVSSSGHLAIIQQLYINATEAQLPNPLLFDIFLHLGTLTAVFIAFHKDIRDLIIAFFALFTVSGRNNEKIRPSRRMLILILIATLPVLVAAFFADTVEVLMESLYFIGGALILTGFLLFVADRIKPGRKNEKTARVSDAALVGVMQAIAVIPGLSRSGSTIWAGIMRGFDRQFAITFSFLMSIPAVLGATVLHLVKAVKEGVDFSEMFVFIPGMLVAAVVGYFAIILLKRMAAKGRFGAFAVYCVSVGVVTVILPFIID
ncbi:MAG: undecaprenyl-diphosphate phosphatase [Oscillospiraceae bacterium]|nr:undecaprenyl-diphosphate phosphatase [Oscillospiraceae bacterium]